jgi:hypothetical protein
VELDLLDRLKTWWNRKTIRKFFSVIAGCPRGEPAFFHWAFFIICPAPFFSPSLLHFEFEFLLVLAVDLRIASVWTVKNITRPERK